RCTAAAGRRAISRFGALRPSRARRGPRPRGGLGQRPLPRGARGRRDQRSLRGADRRHRRRGAKAEGKTGARHLPCRRRGARGAAGGGSSIRRRTRGSRGRPGGHLRPRGRGRPHRSGRRAARARRQRCRHGPRGAAAVISHPAYTVEPWSVRETHLDLDVLAQSESVFALANGHIGLRANLDEGEPFGLPGTYLNSFYELRPLPHAEAAYGNPESGTPIVHVTNGKIMRLLVDDEPFDVRYGKLLAHERELDLRAGVLRRRAEWRSPAGTSVRLRTTRLVSFTQRAAAAIMYEVEPLDGPLRIVVQSELVANEAGAPAQDDPRAAAVLEAPLVSEHYFDRDGRVGMSHSTKRSKQLLTAR